MLDEFKAAVLPGWYGELSIEYFETALSQPRRELLERPFRPRKSFRETRRYCERGFGMREISTNEALGWRLRAQHLDAPLWRRTRPTRAGWPCAGLR